MSHSLAIGRLPEPLLPAVTLWLQQALSIPSIRARSIGQSWADYSEQVDIDALNLASVELFLDHAASLEGLRNSAEAIEAGKWRNLPYWIESVWVPLGSSGAEPQVLNADYAP